MKAESEGLPSKLLITSTGGTSQEVSTTYLYSNVGVWFVTEDIEVKLAQGENTITIGKSGEQNTPQAVNWVAIDKETTPGQPVEEEFDIYQPNDASATIYGGGTVNSDETNGCTGGVFYDAIGSGRGISYNYNAAETGQRTVRIRYACAYSNAFSGCQIWRQVKHKKLLLKHRDGAA